jgi:hypothetical protein
LPIFIYLFSGDANEEEIEAAMDKYTTLTGWFELNKNDTEARQYKYTDIPFHYKWEKGVRIKRKNRFTSKTLTRLLFVQPSDCERYALRLLLLHHPGGIIGFDSLRLINRNDGLHPDFYSAAAAAGLVHTNQESIECLQEALQGIFIKIMFFIFIYLCIF